MASGVPRDRFEPGDLDFPRISAPSPRVFTPSGTPTARLQWSGGEAGWGSGRDGGPAGGHEGAPGPVLGGGGAGRRTRARSSADQVLSSGGFLRGFFWDSGRILGGGGGVGEGLARDPQARGSGDPALAPRVTSSLAMVPSRGSPSGRDRSLRFWKSRPPPGGLPSTRERRGSRGGRAGFGEGFRHTAVGQSCPRPHPSCPLPGRRRPPLPRALQ